MARASDGRDLRQDAFGFVHRSLENQSDEDRPRSGSQQRLHVLRSMMRRHVLRLALGFFAIAPLLVIALVLAVVFGVRSETVPLLTVVIVSTIVGLLLYGTAVIYFLYVIQTDDRFDSSDKARWSFLLVMWFPFAAIWFWYQFVWRDRSRLRP